MSRFLHCRRWDDSVLFGNIIILAFILVQALDGIFTYWGVYFGYRAEGNPIGAFFISAIGLGPGILVLKLTGVGLGMFLHLRGYHTLITGLIIFYLVFAIVPWILVFLGWL